MSVPAARSPSRSGAPTNPQIRRVAPLARISSQMASFVLAALARYRRRRATGSMTRSPSLLAKNGLSTNLRLWRATSTAMQFVRSGVVEAVDAIPGP